MSDAEDKSIDYRWLRLRPLNPNLLTDDDDSDLDESTKRKEIIDPSKASAARNLRPRNSSTKTGRSYDATCSGCDADARSIALCCDQQEIVKVLAKTKRVKEKVFPSLPQKSEGVVTRSQTKGAFERTQTNKEDRSPRVCSVNIKIKKHGKLKHSRIIESRPTSQSHMNDTTPRAEAPFRIRRHSTMRVKNKHEDYEDPEWTPKMNSNQKRHKMSFRLRAQQPGFWSVTPETPSSSSVNGKTKSLVSAWLAESSTPTRRKRGRPCIPRRLWAHIESSVSSSDCESTVPAKINRPVIQRKYLKNARKDNAAQSFDSGSSQSSEIYADILSQHTLQQNHTQCDGSQQPKVETVDLSESCSLRSVVHQQYECDDGNEVASSSPQNS